LRVLAAFSSGSPAGPNNVYVNSPGCSPVFFTVNEKSTS
jgi:hypothetical protein